MNLYGRHTSEVAERIVNAFRSPETLPKALAPIFIRRGDSDIPCRKWSFANQMIVAISGSMDARGINQWRDAGRKINAGCHAVWILAPLVAKKHNDQTGEDETRVYGFKSIPVFRAEDTNGEPLDYQAENAELQEWIESLPLAQVAKNWGLKLDTYSAGETSPQGFYRPMREIQLGVKNLSTWAHELTHAADDQLGTLAHTKFGTGEYAIGEVVAQLGAAILLTVLGLETDADLGGSYRYIASWSQRETDTDKAVHACIKVLDRACRCVNLIIETAESLQEESAVAV